MDLSAENGFYDIVSVRKDQQGQADQLQNLVQITRAQSREQRTGQLHKKRETAHINQHADPPPKQLPQVRAKVWEKSAETGLRWGQHRGTVSMVRSEISRMKLDQYLKWMGWVSTGGEAKQRIQMGEVEVNGSVETRRGRQLSAGDRVVLAGEESVVSEEKAIGP